MLDKMFTPLSLLILNMLIIAVVEAGGEFFFTSGLIHAFALFFIALAFARMFGHSYTHDPILEQFVHMSLAAMAVFAFSHILEFFSLVVLHTYEDATFANVANLYMISLILMTMGAELFLRIYERRSRAVLVFLSTGAALLLLLTVVFSVKDELISLEPDSPVPYIYAAVMGFFALYAFTKVRRIKNLVPAAVPFCTYLLASVALIVLAIMVNIFYEFLEDGFAWEEYQIIFLSHYAFFASLSVLFLAFGKLAFLGGIYKELQDLDEKK